MGQRAYRGKITDSIINTYIKKSDEKNYCSDAWGLSTASNTREIFEPDSFFEGKLIDLQIEFDLDNPLLNMTDFDSVLTKGIINSKLQKGKRINNLHLVIKSKLFGTGKCYLNFNFYVLFGSYFFKDVGNISIDLINPVTDRRHNDRNAIINLLDFIVFKTIKQVRVNNSLLYYVIPEYSEFAIVLAYRDINLAEIKDGADFSSFFEELVYHPYSTFEHSAANYNRCLAAIDKTVPSSVCNLILPIVKFNDLHWDEHLGDFEDFLIKIAAKFRIVSLEVKINFENDKNKINKEIQFVSDIVLKHIDILTKFNFIFLAFDFSPINLTEGESMENDQIQNCFRSILRGNNKLRNVSLAQHTNHKKENERTGLIDKINFYDYIYFNKCFAQKIGGFLYATKKSKKLNKLYKRKFIVMNILRSLYDTDAFFKTNRVDFSAELVRNKKIVPMELSRDNVVIFSN